MADCTHYICFMYRSFYQNLSISQALAFLYNSLGVEVVLGCSFSCQLTTPACEVLSLASTLHLVFNESPNNEEYNSSIIPQCSGRGDEIVIRCMQYKKNNNLVVLLTDKGDQ